MLSGFSINVVHEIHAHVDGKMQMQKSVLGVSYACK